MDIILTGNPLSTQNVYKIASRGGFARMYMSKEGKDRKEEYHWELKQQWGRKKPLQGNLSIGIDLYFGDKRKRDWDNFHKLSMDAMSGIVWDDDSQVLEAVVKKEYDKKNPRIEINIIKID